MPILDPQNSIGTLMEKVQAPGGEHNLTQKEREEWEKLNTVLGPFMKSLDAARVSLLSPIELITKRLQGVRLPSLYPTPEQQAENERLISEVLAEEQASEKLARPERVERQDLRPTPDGGFVYRESRLQGLSTDSQHGKLLFLFLTVENSIARDKEIRHVTGVSNGRDFGFVLRNLKRALERNGLEPTIERRKALPGYVYLGVQPILQPP